MTDLHLCVSASLREESVLYGALTETVLLPASPSAWKVFQESSTTHLAFQLARSPLATVSPTVHQSVTPLALS